MTLLVAKMEIERPDLALPQCPVRCFSPIPVHWFYSSARTYLLRLRRSETFPPFTRVHT